MTGTGSASATSRRSGESSTKSDATHDDDDNDTNVEAGSTEAGIVRGVSRSVAQRAVAARSSARTLAKLPSVGRLPRSSPLKAASSSGGRMAVPVKRVARLTDRMSTGLDVWESASTSTGDGNDRTRTKEQQQTKHKRQLFSQQKIAVAATFATSLVKNTVLGAIVFESYCWMVANTDSFLPSKRIPASPASNDPLTAPNEDDNEKDVSVQLPIYRDIFETTPVISHYAAGAVAGSLQGVGGTIWDTTALSLASRKVALPTSLQPVARTTGQHALAHSILFGSYETCKRLILQFIFNIDSPDPEQQQEQQQHHQRLEYFAGVSIAGGLAGQFQHIASSVLELRWTTTSTRTLLRWQSLPSLRSTLWAFPPSAIAFLAFEYGKDTVVDLAAEDGDGDD